MTTIEFRFPHVWDVNGRPRGVMHRLTLRGETLVVEDVGLDEHGEVLDVGADRTEIPFVDAVHILLNLTPEERARFGIERTQRPTGLRFISAVETIVECTQRPADTGQLAERAPNVLREEIARLTLERDREFDRAENAERAERIARSNEAAARTHVRAEVRASILESIQMAKAEGGAHHAAVGWLAGLLATLDADARGER